jgi:hypothetical protein
MPNKIKKWTEKNSKRDNLDSLISNVKNIIETSKYISTNPEYERVEKDIEKKEVSELLSDLIDVQKDRKDILETILKKFVNEVNYVLNQQSFDDTPSYSLDPLEFMKEFFEFYFDGSLTNKEIPLKVIKDYMETEEIFYDWRADDEILLLFPYNL